MIYAWENKETGEVVDHTHYSQPPSKPGKWTRIYSFGAGRVSGAAGSPARPSLPKVLDIDRRKGEYEDQRIYLGHD